MFQTMSKVTQGSAGLGAALGYFCSKGIIVSLPLIDNQDYDLVIDEGGILKKVQVKTTGTRNKSRNYEVQLKAVRSNRTENKIKRFDSKAVDYLFILCDNADIYLIPCKDINVTCSLTLTQNTVKYKL